jgi:hypothetical protein
MNKQNFLRTVLLISSLGPVTASAQESGRPDGMRFVPDVVAQFNSLTERPDPLGFHVGGSPNPSSCRHYQGMVRAEGPDGTPYFIVSRSGNLPSTFPLPGLICDDSPGETGNGNLIVFRMGSRDKNGERMRSNRLARGSNYDQTEPPEEDAASIYFTVVDGGLVFFDGDDTLPPRVYQHPGGMQLIGHILALPVESPRQFGPDSACTRCAVSHDLSSPDCQSCYNYERAPHPTLVMFFDVSNPQLPVFKSQFPLVNRQGDELEDCGILALTPLADDHYLMMVTGTSTNSTLYFYRSNSTDLESTSWYFVDEWHADAGPTCIPDPSHPFSEICFCEGGSPIPFGEFCLSPDEEYLEQNWPTEQNGDHTHQMLQFLREGDLDGTLYLAGARGLFGSDDTAIDLYRVDCETPLCDSGEIKLKHISSRQLSPFPNAGGAKLVSFAAASTFYVSPSGELLLYATEHDNDGPGETVKAGEWRHIFMARDDSPTFSPTATVGGPFEVDEGSSVSLTGSASPPITRPFIQLFTGLHLSSRFGGLYAVVDQPDYGLDDFDNLFDFQRSNSGLLGFYGQTRSWNWFAPAGCKIVAVAQDIFDPSVPIETKTLAGTGLVQHDPDLREVLNDGGTGDMDRKVSSVRFEGCDEYYSMPFVLKWDLDGNGSFETTGTSVAFSTAAIDGPATVNVPVEAQYPSGGPAGQATAQVIIRNVPPQLAGFRITDAAGHQVNVEVPFLLTKVPATVAADFTDPGVLDHQSATLKWGDGSVESQSAFSTFDEAFGDGTGAVSQTHRYLVAGLYTIALSVADDDGGVGSQAAVVRVVTPEQAVQEIIAMIDSAIAGATDDKIRAVLKRARRALVGSASQSSDGALNMIKAGNDAAAVSFLQDALFWLRDAQARGTNLATEIALLEQVIAALSAN